MSKCRTIDPDRGVNDAVVGTLIGFTREKSC